MPYFNVIKINTDEIDIGVHVVNKPHQQTDISIQAGKGKDMRKICVTGKMTTHGPFEDKGSFNLNLDSATTLFFGMYEAAMLHNVKEVLKDEDAALCTALENATFKSRLWDTTLHLSLKPATQMKVPESPNKVLYGFKPLTDHSFPVNIEAHLVADHIYVRNGEAGLIFTTAHVIVSLPTEDKDWASI